MNEEEILVEPIEITRENFIELQKNSKELHELKRTFYEKRNNNEVVAYDPINQSIAVIEKKEFVDPHLEWSEEFIGDYGRSESNEEVLIEYLTDYYPDLFKNAVEGKYDESEMIYQDYWVEKIETNIF